jgi:hypothetical protein
LSVSKVSFFVPTEPLITGEIVSRAPQLGSSDILTAGHIVISRDDGSRRCFDILVDRVTGKPRLRLFMTDHPPRNERTE